MTAPRPPYRSAFPFWALLLWLALGVSVWPAQAMTPPAPSSPALVGDQGLFGLALPRDAGGQWQRRDHDEDPGWDPEPPGPLATLALALPGATSPPRAVGWPCPAPRFPRHRQSAPRAPPL